MHDKLLCFEVNLKQLFSGRWYVYKYHIYIRCDTVGKSIDTSDFYYILYSNLHAYNKLQLRGINISSYNQSIFGKLKLLCTTAR